MAKPEDQELADSYEADVATVLLGMHRVLQEIEAKLEQRMAQHDLSVEQGLASAQARCESLLEQCIKSEQVAAAKQAEAEIANAAAQGFAAQLQSAMKDLELRINQAAITCTEDANRQVLEAVQACKDASKALKADAYTAYKALELQSSRFFSKVDAAFAARNKQIGEALTVAQRQAGEAYKELDSLKLRSEEHIRSVERHNRRVLNLLRAIGAIALSGFVVLLVWVLQ